MSLAVSSMPSIRSRHTSHLGRWTTSDDNVITPWPAPDGIGENVLVHTEVCGLGICGIMLSGKPFCAIVETPGRSTLLFFESHKGKYQLQDGYEFPWEEV